MKKEINQNAIDELNLLIEQKEKRSINDLLIASGDTSINIETFKSINEAVFFEKTNFRYIPTKVEYAIRKYVSKKDLKTIHSDFETSVELCLMFLSNLSNAFYENKNGWKNLHSLILREQLLVNDNTYIKVIETLLKGTANGPIIETDNHFILGKKTKSYRLIESYRNKGVFDYEFKTNVAKNLLRKNYFKKLNAATSNVIASNLLKVYQTIELPSLEEIEEEAHRLISMNYVTKKGKKLTFLNKRSLNRFKNVEEWSFVEDSIKLFERLTAKGYMIPSISEENAGGRVVDSFSLMPSWIRNMVKINGQRIEEADYTALHPNLAIKLYEGTKENISHQEIAEELKIDIKTVKIEHLSFFNKRIEGMEKSPLFNYYAKNEGKMLLNVIKDKKESKFGHKVTSRKMFKLEVEIMTEAIRRLNELGVYVIYVYDALNCSKNSLELVKKVMNEVIEEMGVKTIAK